ncbi:hypothetical protein ACET3Z_011005 [Daucus carota]
MFNRLNSLQLSRTDWKIKIRVTRAWDSFSSSHEFIGMNLIIIDEEDYHIHAFVVAEACASLGSYFFEGNMYIIENFATRRSIGYLRPVTSAMCIILNQSTSVTPVPLELGLIARHKFEITELGDVYSIIRNLAPDHNMTRVVCSGEIVQSLLPILEGDFQTNPIVILSSMKPHFHKGMEAHDHISALDDSKNSWNLTVRVTRIWVTRYRSGSRTGSVFRHNMILLDCLNNQIAAVVYPELWEKIRYILVEGRVYTIVDVRVNNATGDFMPVPNQRILMLTNSTTITPHVQDTGIIPFHRFNYKTIPDLDGLVRGNGHVVYRTFSIDVIGLLEDLQPLQKVQTIDGLEDVVKFRIYDGRFLSCFHILTVVKF